MLSGLVSPATTVDAFAFRGEAETEASLLSTLRVAFTVATATAGCIMSFSAQFNHFMAALP